MEHTRDLTLHMQAEASKPNLASQCKGKSDKNVRQKRPFFPRSGSAAKWVISEGGAD
jgi:hypothetical protein